MSDIHDAYLKAVAAVRIYARIVQEMPSEERHAMLFVADDIEQAEGESFDCLITGSAPQLAELLVNAGEHAPRLACAVVASAEHLKGVALQYVAGRPWPVSNTPPEQPEQFSAEARQWEEGGQYGG